MVRFCLIHFNAWLALVVVSSLALHPEIWPTHTSSPDQAPSFLHSLFSSPGLLPAQSTLTSTPATTSSCTALSMHTPALSTTTPSLRRKSHGYPLYSHNHTTTAPGSGRSLWSEVMPQCPFAGAKATHGHQESCPGWQLRRTAEGLFAPSALHYVPNQSLICSGTAWHQVQLF